jgi:hybrid cluster-associated redox disulfide protein
MFVTKDTKIGEMLELDREIAMILMQSGMHCVGCLSSINETLEEACIVHKLETTQFINCSLVKLVLECIE